MLLRLADWFLAQIPIPRSLFIPIIAFFGNNDIENYEGKGDDDDEENYAFARTAAPPDFLIFVYMKLVFIFSLQSVEMPQLEAGYYVEVQTWISYLCPPLCRVRRRGASPLDPSFMLLLYIWTLGYIRLSYLGALICLMLVIVAFSPHCHRLHRLIQYVQPTPLILCSNPPHPYSRFSPGVIMLRIMRIPLHPPPHNGCSTLGGY